MTKTEAQEVVDGLEDALLYAPEDVQPLVQRAINDLVERYDVISDDSELTFTG